MNRYDIVLNNYIEAFGDDEDICEYVSTWDYDENDFSKLAQKLENCIEKRKQYKKLYVSFLEKIYCKTIYKVITKNIEDL